MRRLVVCSDGTWNRADAANPTNVVKLYRSVQSQADGVTQIPWYDPGVGTRNRLSAAVGGLTGLGLTQNIEDAYRFLVRNYEPGDELYLFGFSRGAYTVRSLGGLIRNSGILRRGYEARVRMRSGSTATGSAIPITLTYSSSARTFRTSNSG